MIDSFLKVLVNILLSVQSLLSVQAGIFFLTNLTTHQENQIQERREQEKNCQDCIKHSEWKAAYRTSSNKTHPLTIPVF